MAVLHCETCGAKVKTVEGKLTAVCEYCGNEMTVFNSTAEFEVDTKGTLVQYNGKGGDVVLPEGLVKIADHAFFQNDRILTVTVPASVKVIGAYAFAECGELEEIKLPEGLETILDHAFAECTALRSIEIPDGILAIKQHTFWGCHALKTVILPDSIRKIEERAFQECRKLQSIDMPARLRSVGRSAFLRCTGLTQVRFGNKLESMENCAFADCTSLLSVNLPDSLESMDIMCFSGCTALKEIHIPKNLSVIPGWCFDKCRSLTELHIPGTVKTIEKYAFLHCSGIQTLTLEEGIEVVGTDAFSGLTSLSGKLVVPQSITHMSQPSGTQITELVVGKAVETWNYMGNFSKSLTKLTILPGVSQLMKAAFYNCKRLRSVEFPEGLQTICEGAFWECHSLESLTLPNSLVTIEQRGFQNCKALTAVHFRSIKDARLTTIMDHAFEDCPLLRNVSLPNTLQTIGEYAFYTLDARNCHFYLPGTVSKIGTNAFGTSFGAKSTIHSPRNSTIESYCQRNRLDCSWDYLPSVQEQRASLQSNIAKLRQAQQTVASNKSAADSVLDALAKQIDQEFILLNSLTGVFAGGKRKKCQERIDALRQQYVAKQQIADQHAAQLANLAAQIQAEEIKLQKLGM